MEPEKQTMVEKSPKFKNTTSWLCGISSAAWSWANDHSHCSPPSAEKQIGNTYLVQTTRIKQAWAEKNVQTSGSRRQMQIYTGNGAMFIIQKNHFLPIWLDLGLGRNTEKMSAFKDCQSKEDYTLLWGETTGTPPWPNAFRDPRVWLPSDCF